MASKLSCLQNISHITLFGKRKIEKLKLTASMLTQRTLPNTRELIYSFKFWKSTSLKGIGRQLDFGGKNVKKINGEI